MKLKLLLGFVFVLLLCSVVSAFEFSEYVVHVYDFAETLGVLQDNVGDKDSTEDNVDSKTVTGINGNAWNFSRPLGHNVTLPALLDGNATASVTFWAKANALGATSFLFGVADASDEGGVFTTGTDITFRLHTTGAPDCAISNPDLDKWYMYTIVYNGTKVIGYINDTQCISNENPSGNIGGGITKISDRPAGGLQSGFDGAIDELYIYNSILLQENVTEIFNSGTGTFYSVVSATAAPTIVVPSPADNANNNTNVTLNVSHSSGINDVRYWLYFSDTTPLTEAHLYLKNVTRTASEYREFITNVSDGTYYWKWKVQNITDGTFSSNTTERTWILDTTLPTITLNSGNFFKADNSTQLSSFTQNGTFDITFFDDNLFNVLINVTNSSGTSIFERVNTSVGTQTTANYTDTLNISGINPQNLTIILKATDSHTAISISDYDVIKSTLGKYLEYSTAEGNTIKITSLDNLNSFNTIKLKDRYKFDFDFKDTQATYSFRVTSDNKIYYDSKSEYKAHFIILSENGNGNWLDFENPYLNKGDYTVTKINDYEYQVDITSKGMKNFDFDSLGGLNVVEKHYRAEVTSTFEIWGFNNATNGSIAFSATIDGVKKSGGAGGSALFGNITKGTHTILMEATNFLSLEVDFEATGTWHNLTINLTTTELFDNCTLFSTNAINFTLLNITNDIKIDGNLNYLFTYNDSINTSRNYSLSVIGFNFSSFCVQGNNVLNSEVLIDYTVKGVTYEYSLTNLTLDSTSKNVNLYTQDGTTVVTFTVTDLFDSPIAGAFIKILKHDVGTNTFKTVEIIKTNNDGEAVGNIVLFTIWYKFFIDVEGRTLLVTEPSKIFSTTKKFRVDTAGADWFGNFDTVLGVATSLNFTNSTLNFAFTWNDPSGAVHNGCLQVVKLNRTTETTICDTCIESTAATILCNLGTGADVNGNRYIAQGYFKFDLIYMSNILEKIFGGGEFIKMWEQGAEQKEFGVFLSFLIILTLTFIGIWSPVAAITMTLVGFFIVSTLGFIKLQTSAFMTLAILGLIVIYKISRR